MGPRRTTGAANCGSADRLLSALPHLGMAWSARLSSGRESPLRQRNSSPTAPKKKGMEGRKNLIQFGHLRKTPCRASLRSDNCPTIPDQCPTISDWVSEFIGIRMIGTAGSLALSQVLAAQLFEVSRNDPAVLITIGLTIFLVATLASWIPARRAANVDPMVALRYE
jgi:hypothetical protein